MQEQNKSNDIRQSGSNGEGREGVTKQMKVKKRKIHTDAKITERQQTHVARLNEREMQSTMEK